MPIIEGVGSFDWNRTVHNALVGEATAIAARSSPPILRLQKGIHSLGFQLCLNARVVGKKDTYIESLEYARGIISGAEYLYAERDTETFLLKEDDSTVSAPLGRALRQLSMDTGASVYVLYDAASNFLNIEIEGYRGPVDRPDALLAEVAEKLNRWVSESR